MAMPTSFKMSVDDTSLRENGISLEYHSQMVMMLSHGLLINHGVTERSEP